MRANAGILIFICLLFLVGTVGAVVGIPDTVTVTTNKPWIVANNVDTSTIIVTVMNTTTTPTDYSGPVQGVTVNLVVNDTVYGTLSPTPVTTDVSGKASSTFKVKTKSGAAQITATAWGLSGSTIQNIDHEVPVKVNLQYPLEGEVASEVPFNISVIDRWGNPIDGRNTNQVHSLSLRIDGPDTYCGFNNGSLYSQTLSRPLDINGNLSVQVRLSKIIGDNNIQIASPFTMAKIVGIATSVPVRMEVSILKSGGLGLAYNEVRANLTDYFIFEYYLYDIYGNPVQNRSIGVRTNLTDELTQKFYTTNSFGQIQVKYGPKTSLLTANITAIAVDNSSVTKSVIVNFVSGVAQNMLLVITPQTIASWDSNATYTTREAKVVASLTDAFGNPINGKKVTFTILSNSIVTAPYTKTADYTGNPRFESGSASLTKDTTTDKGYAITTLYPGAFVTEGQSGYSDSATGSCEVTASYIASDGTPFTSAPVKVQWKNFAYLSVTVNATPQTVRVNESIDVTIRITGDGYNMVENPITVVLDMDTSSSMNAKDSTGGDRFNNSKLAAKSFVSSLKPEDQVGLVTYGDYSMNVYWQLVQNLSLNHDDVITSIDSLVEKGGLDFSVRQSIDEAVTKIETNTFHPNGEVAAIITLGDSAYNNNAVDYDAMVHAWTGHHTRIYTIQYISSNRGCDTGDTKVDQMHLLADNAGGIPFCCTNKDEVDLALDEIRQNLSTIAGVNTQMTLDFSNVQINSTTYNGTMTGGQVFDYVSINAGLPGEYINHTKGSVDPDGRTSIIWTDGNQSVVDQSDDWTAANNYQLKFNIGTIRIDETWETTFRLNVTKEGLIQLFGPGSKISYNGDEGKLTLPATYINALNASTPIGLGNGTLALTNLVVPGTVTDSIPVQWTISYSGFATATETISSSYNNGPWAIFGTRNIGPTSGDVIEYAQMNVQGVNGGTYRIKVRADTPDAGSKELISGTIIVEKSGATLRLE